MNKLLLVLLVWLTGCANLPMYTTVPPVYLTPTTNVAVFRSLTGTPAGYLYTTKSYRVEGLTDDGWYIVRGYGGRYLVAASAFPGVDLAARNVVGSASSYNSSAGYSPTPEGTTHDTYTGPRGGHYYINGNGNKSYVTPQSTINSQNVQTGPRGGQYYINSHGNKSYIKH